jgi:hypothetical protein
MRVGDLREQAFLPDCGLRYLDVPVNGNGIAKQNPPPGTGTAQTDR